jgi:raffinose/stachyose/melibiose transport system permease protein
MTRTSALTPRLLLGVFALLTILPFALVIMTSLKSETDVFAGPFAFPAHLHFENYLTAWEQGRFSTYFLNSLIVVLGVLLPSMLLSILSGFAFAYLRVPARRSLTVILLLGMVLPTEAFIIPLWYELRALDLLNTYWALIIPQIAQSIPFGTLFMASAFRQVPLELVEASLLDGAERRDVLWRVLVPLVMPAASTLALFLFIWTWNEFLMALVLVTDDSVRTLPTGLLFFQSRYTVNIPVLTAGAVITLVPIVLVYFLFQRRLITGLTAGAVK